MIRPNSEGHPEPDHESGEFVEFYERDAVINDTYPHFIVDGVELTDVQSRDFEEILDNCAGDQKLASDCWRLAWVNDGEKWLPMDQMYLYEVDPLFMSEVEGAMAGGLEQTSGRVTASSIEMGGNRA